MNIFKFIFQNVLLIFFCSCGKDTYHTIVSGTIINSGTKQPIDSVLVVLKDGIYSGGGWVNGGSGSTSSDAQVSTRTDKNGNFNLELKGQYSAMLSVTKKGYWEYIDSECQCGFKHYDEGKTYKNQVLELDAEAEFKATFFNSIKPDTIIITPFIPEKNILYSSWSTECYNQEYCYFTGYPCIGDKYLKFQLEIKQKNTWQTRIDSVYIKSHETFRDTINY